MHGRQLFPAFVAGFFLLLASIAPASATTLTLGTSTSLSLQPGETGNFTFSATNDAGAITNFLGWAIGFQMVPVDSPTGSLTVGFLTQPVVAPMPPGGIDFTQPNLVTLGSNAVINGQTQFWSIGASANDDVQTVNSLATYNLGSVAFTASLDATPGSTWQIHAVQQAGSFIKSYWTDDNFADAVFGNWPSAPVGNTSVQIGTISVVPEPSSLMLAASAIMGAGWYGWRSRRNPLVVEA